MIQISKNLQIIGVLIVVAIFSGSIQPASRITAQATEPANPDLSPQASDILDYLYQLPSQAQNRVVLGQFGGYGEGQTYDESYQQVRAVYERTGHWPALTGADCAMPGGMSEASRFLGDMWAQNFWVNLSCHFRNPWTGGESHEWEDESTDDPWDRRNVRELLTRGSAANSVWMRSLDEVADGLQTLQEAGVIVFWRPLHEMNGDWFWWGAQEPADYIALWQQMFDYFTFDRGLNNLLWVYSPNSHFEDAVRFYPGGSYVDVVSLDVYMDLDEDPLNINSLGEYDALVSTGKPIALFEFGPSPATGAGWDTTDYDWTNLTRDIRAHYPQIVLIQAWEYIWQLSYERYQGLDELVNDPWILTRDDLISEGPLR